MRQLRAALALLTLTVVAGCTSNAGPTPVPPVSQPPDPFKSVLQPLDLGSSWWYTEGEQGDVAFVNAVIGEDIVNDRPVRWLQLSFGEGGSIRLGCIVQDGDVYVAATEVPGDGAWDRTVLPEPVLYRPGPGPRTWKPVYPDSGSPLTDWQQSASGEQRVLGAPRALWTAERRVRTEQEGEVLQKVIRAERVGLFQLVLSAPDGTNPTTYELAALFDDTLPFQGVWAGAGPGTEDGQPQLWYLDFGTVRRIVTPVGAGTLTDFTEEAGGAATFGASLGGTAFTWTGRHFGPGLSGIATYGDRRFVIDFRWHPELVSQPATSPSPGPAG